MIQYLTETMDQSPSLRLLWHLPPLPLLTPVHPLLWPCRYPSNRQQETIQTTFTPHFIEDILGEKRDQKFLRCESEGISDYAKIINHSSVYISYLNHDFHQDLHFQPKIILKDWTQMKRMKRKRRKSEPLSQLSKYLSWRIILCWRNIWHLQREQN